MRSDEVLDTAFTPTQFRRGYDEREVDELLDDVVLALRHHEGGGSRDTAPMRAEAIAQVRFTQTQYRRGYDEEEVDALLDRVKGTLEAFEGGMVQTASARSPDPSPPHPSPASTPTAGDPPGRGVGAGILRWLRGEPR
ncbi:MAG: DivIVA domain-containing protein [Ornithinibacter sp.]